MKLIHPLKPMRYEMKSYELRDLTRPHITPIVVSEKAARDWWENLSDSEKEIFVFVNVEDSSDKIPPTESRRRE
jgi:hypothetical protein